MRRRGNRAEVLRRSATSLRSAQAEPTALLRRILRQINAEQTAAPPRILDSGERLAVLLEDVG
jgi:hypothetical protein